MNQVLNGFCQAKTHKSAEKHTARRGIGEICIALAGESSLPISSVKLSQRKYLLENIRRAFLDTRICIVSHMRSSESRRSRRKNPCRGKPCESLPCIRSIGPSRFHREMETAPDIVVRSARSPAVVSIAAALIAFARGKNRRTVTNILET